MDNSNLNNFSPAVNSLGKNFFSYARRDSVCEKEKDKDKDKNKEKEKEKIVM